MLVLLNNSRNSRAMGMEGVISDLEEINYSNDHF